MLIKELAEKCGCTPQLVSYLITKGVIKGATNVKIGYKYKINIQDGYWINAIYSAITGRANEYVVYKDDKPIFHYRRNVKGLNTNQNNSFRSSLVAFSKAIMTDKEFEIMVKLFLNLEGESVRNLCKRLEIGYPETYSTMVDHVLELVNNAIDAGIVKCRGKHDAE